MESTYLSNTFDVEKLSHTFHSQEGEEKRRPRCCLQSDIWKRRLRLSSVSISTRQKKTKHTVCLSGGRRCTDSKYLPQKSLRSFRVVFLPASSREKDEVATETTQRLSACLSVWMVEEDKRGAEGRGSKQEIVRIVICHI